MKNSPVVGKNVGKNKIDWSKKIDWKTTLIVSLTVIVVLVLSYYHEQGDQAIMGADQVCQAMMPAHSTNSLGIANGWWQSASVSKGSDNVIYITCKQMNITSIDTTG